MNRQGPSAVIPTKAEKARPGSAKRGAKIAKAARAGAKDPPKDAFERTLEDEDVAPEDKAALLNSVEGMAH